MWIIEFYRTDDGACPVEMFIDSPVYKEDQPFFLRAFGLLEEFGNLLREPHTRPLTDGIFELRVASKSGIFRFPFFYDKGKIIIITHAFRKKTQKTPRHEIETAKNYRDHYFRQKEQRK